MTRTNFPYGHGRSTHFMIEDTSIMSGMSNEKPAEDRDLLMLHI